MSVLVEFPGGICREVPSQLRAVDAPQDDLAAFEQVPLNCDPQWKYEREQGRWIAVHRQGQLLSMRPVAPAWWQLIEMMMEPERHAQVSNLAEDSEVALQSAA